MKHDSRSGQAMIASIALLWVVLGVTGQAASNQPPLPPIPISGLVERLDSGWTLISSPVGIVTPDEIRGTCVFTSGPWQWDGAQYQLVNLIEPPKAYWVRVKQPCTMEATGFLIYRKLDLHPGWNLISSSWSWQQLTSPQLANVTGANFCVLQSGPWRFNNGLNEYLPVDLSQPLNPFRGYWVKVGGDCTLISAGLSLKPEENSFLPPGLPHVSSEGTFFTHLTQLLGLTQTIPIALDYSGVRLQLPGRDTGEREIFLYNLDGQLVAHRAKLGRRVNLIALSDGGKPLANGVYLYLLITRGPDGQIRTSEARKLVILRNNATP